MAGRTGRAVQVDVGDGDPDRVGVGSMAVALGVALTAVLAALLRLLA